MFEPTTGIEMNITWIMSAHVGAEKPISATDLTKALVTHDHDITEAALRNTIHDMRQRGYLIASSKDGYYLPSNLQEAMAYVDDQLRTPARDMLQTVRRQRQAAREHFGGQLSMFG